MLGIQHLDTRLFTSFMGLFRARHKILPTYEDGGYYSTIQQPAIGCHPMDKRYIRMLRGCRLNLIDELCYLSLCIKGALQHFGFVSQKCD